MIEVPLIDELRETRRRLAEQAGYDVERYAAMLREVANRIPGKYVNGPLLSVADKAPAQAAVQQSAATSG